MSRHTLILTVTVDVDDPMSVRAAALEVDDVGIPSLDGALGSVVLAAIGEHAVPALEARGVDVVMMGHASAADQP